MELPGGAFVPPPKVSVGLVKMVPHHEPFIKDLPFHFVNKVVTGLFLNKNQKYLNSIRTNLIPVKVSLPNYEQMFGHAFCPLMALLQNYPTKNRSHSRLPLVVSTFPDF